MVKDAERWAFCQDHECPYCQEEIFEESVKRQTIVTKCPFCDRSFCD